MTLSLLLRGELVALPNLPISPRYGESLLKSPTAI